MKRIPKGDWDPVHELACEIVNASSEDEEVVVASRMEALMCLLRDLEEKYGVCSRITATRADYAADTERAALYHEALIQAKAEGDTENVRLILESLTEISEES